MQAGAHVYDHYSINTIARISQIFIHASRRFKSVAGSQRELRGRRGCITYPHKGKRPSVRPFTIICPLRLDLKYFKGRNFRVQKLSRVSKIAKFREFKFREFCL